MVPSVAEWPWSPTRSQRCWVMGSSLSATKDPPCVDKLMHLKSLETLSHPGDVLWKLEEVPAQVLSMSLCRKASATCVFYVSESV
ncbi:hypothetical protein TNCV_2428391 [Trichonephila clavipes]|nr:hypothetical protein TNCV_2428391 [Trichonephila clavipes]